MEADELQLLSRRINASLSPPNVDEEADDCMDIGRKSNSIMTSVMNKRTQKLIPTK